MKTLTNIKNGDFTNKGGVKMVDKPWVQQDGSVADRLVITTEGAFRETELTIVEKPISMTRDEWERLSELRNAVYNAEDQIDGEYTPGMFSDKYTHVDEAYSNLLKVLRSFDRLMENELKDYNKKIEQEVKAYKDGQESKS